MFIKRFAAFTMIFVFMISMIACTSKNTDSKATVQPVTTASTETAKPQVTADPHAKKFTITALDFTYNDPAPLDGPGLKMINEKFNVDYQPVQIPYNDYAEKLTTTVASGKLSDITVIEDSNDLLKWSKQNAFLELNSFIDQYPSLKLVPKDVWESVTVNGKIVGIPRYWPTIYNSHIVVRQDWLDNLGLKMPTNLEELKQIAIAFTKNDPDKNNKADTYGMPMSEGFWPYYESAAYYGAEAWYHKDKDGNLIPGFLAAEPRKEYLTWLRDMYKAGAITKDFPVIKNPSDAMKDFYSGKAGIFRMSAVGNGEARMTGLLKLNPGAKVVPIPPFKTADGMQGHVGEAGFYGVVALNGKLKDDKEKIARILELIDYGRTFYPLNQRNSSNKEYDWSYGLVGKGYTEVDGKSVITPALKGLMPWYYFPDRSMWAPKDKDNQYADSYILPQLKEVATAMVKLDEAYDHYVSPTTRIYSEAFSTKYFDLMTKMFNEETKIVVGDLPLSDWDKMAQNFLDKGGAVVIKEVNDALKGKKLNSWVKP